MERVAGIEPTSQGSEPGVLSFELYARETNLTIPDDTLTILVLPARFELASEPLGKARSVR